MRECWQPPVYGPGDNDYGRDFMKREWKCPECGNIMMVFNIDIKRDNIKCNTCGYMTLKMKEWEDMFEKIYEKLKAKINNDG